ncbi:hypothetical protein JXB31_00955, partial [Candidatus Woesearchaeota archaeon]|nr:hypothetical protein [Candidatus Woesearchaeota archaeon]
KRYKGYVEKIVKASTEDILYRGIIGHGSELSSARSQKAEASLCQAWSASTFIELYYALSKIK